jgi:hypothetical protein
MNRNTLRVALGFAVAAFFVYLIARQTRTEEVARTLAHADRAWIGAALLAFFCGYACPIERWHLMLSQSNPRLRWTSCAGPLLAGFAANNVLPLRAGDILRSVAFRSSLGSSPGTVVATLFVERLLDLLVILLIFAVMLVLHGGTVEESPSIGGPLLITAASVILVAIASPGFLAPVARVLGGCALRISPGFGGTLNRSIEEGLATLSQLATRNVLAKLLGWSVCAWLAEGCVFWFTALSLPSIQTPSASWFALPAGTLATLIPGTPGYFGTFEYFVARPMIASGASAAAAYALLVHALLWLPSTLAGALYLLIRYIKRSRQVEVP